MQFTVNPDKTKADLAKAVGLEPSGISKILAGSRQIKAHEYMAMRRFFDLPVDGEAAVKRDGTQSYTIRPMQAANALNENDRAPDSEWVIPASILNARTQASPDKIKIFQVCESAMEPDFKQGEHVLVDMSDRQPSPPGVFVVSDGFGHMLRYCAFVPQTNPPEVRISANSDGFQPQTLKIEDFLIAGRVIAKLQMI